MSNNIWGYQGLQTPLENLTNGNYNVADYTNMRREFNARIQALENTGGFIPTNVNIQGYCNIVPGTNGYGNFSATGATILGGTLNVAQTATFQGGMTVSGTLSIANVSAGAVSASSATVSGNITSTAGQFIGNGSGLTNLPVVVPSFITYTTNGNKNLFLTAMDTYITMNGGAGLSPNFFFSNFVIGQKITFIRLAIDLGSVIDFIWTAGSLPYRVLFLSGTTNTFTTGGDSYTMNYTYAGQQKIRSVFLVCSTLGGPSYSFDLVEIS